MSTDYIGTGLPGSPDGDAPEHHEPGHHTAEQLRRRAEEARLAAEAARHEAEQQRADAEEARAAAERVRDGAEQARSAADAVRDEALAGVRETSDTLVTALTHMQRVEELRRQRDRKERES
jgi:nucleoid-associated protein YgaU